MTQNSTEEELEITQAQVREAELAEQTELDESQKKHLMKRVVVLRVQVDNLQRRLTEANAEIVSLRSQLSEFVEDIKVPSD